jgi:hypothetical protein
MKLDKQNTRTVMKNENKIKKTFYFFSHCDINII